MSLLYISTSKLFTLSSRHIVAGVISHKHCIQPPRLKTIRGFAASTKKVGQKPSIKIKPKFQSPQAKEISDNEDEKDRPFTLPPGLYRPNQKLGQNFLSDQNYVLKICNAFYDNSSKGRRVCEIGPGPGALTRVLYERYPDMFAIELDERGVEFLGRKLPGINIINLDVLKFDWAQAAADRGGLINIIANLPYNIVSKLLFYLADHHKAIGRAVVTTQLEVTQRICAEPNTFAYGIPSVFMQLYAKCTMNFIIPPTVFYPQPDVDSALLTVDFTKPHKDLHKVDGLKLRRVVSLAFQHRRKMMRVSLLPLCERDGVRLPEKFKKLRPEQLTPGEFVELTLEMYGGREQTPGLHRCPEVDAANLAGEDIHRDREFYSSEVVMSKPIYTNMHLSKKQLEKLGLVSE